MPKLPEAGCWIAAANHRPCGDSRARVAVGSCQAAARTGRSAASVRPPLEQSWVDRPQPSRHAYSRGIHSEHRQPARCSWQKP